jgi:hypothetical protein
MMYAYIDGDDIGLKIENSFMNNDEISLKSINNKVKDYVEDITRYLISNKYTIIFSGADGIICKAEKINIEDMLRFIQGRNGFLTFSIGVGESLRDSYLALRYAKSNGKNIAAVYNGEFTLIK